MIDPPLWQSPRRARLYVWGYGGSSPWMSGYQCRQSAAARSFATERGWEPDRPESWAVEIPCPSGLHPILREIEPILRADPAVAGWGGQTASVFSPLQTAVPDLRSARDEVERSAPQDNLIERSRTVLNASHAVRAETARLIKKAWQHRREMQQQLDRLAEIPWCRRGADRQRHPALDPAPTPVSSDESILPDPLFDTLNRTVSHSLALAEQGRLVEGYSLLLSGLHDAEEAALELSPWAPQLMQIYQRALENYVWRFGVRLD